MMFDPKFAEYAKGYVALLGSICTAVLGVVGPETQVGTVLVIVSAICTAVATWAVPNAPQSQED